MSCRNDQTTFCFIALAEILTFQMRVYVTLRKKLSVFEVFLVRMRENVDRNNSVYGHFYRSVIYVTPTKSLKNALNRGKFFVKHCGR